MDEPVTQTSILVEPVTKTSTVAELGASINAKLDNIMDLLGKIKYVCK
jgi:hypothetical protein